MPDSRATSAACKGPAPPKANRVSSVTSWPCSVVTARIARLMLAAATRMIPSAASSTEMPRGRAMRASMLARAASRSTGIRPSSSATGLSRLRQMFASVRVGSSPPRP